MEELTSQQQNEDDGEAHGTALLPQSVGEAAIDGISDIFNPLEAIESIFEDPGAGLMAIAGLVAIMLIAGGLWSVVQELFSGGGPPPSLGLK